jgi:hypothetical protein
LSTHLRLGLPSVSFLLASPPISYMHSSSPPFVNAVHLRVKYKEVTSILPGPFREPTHTCIYVTCATFVRIWNRKYSLTGNSHKMWHHCMTWIHHVAYNVVSLWHLPFHELTDTKFKFRMHLPLRTLNSATLYGLWFTSRSKFYHRINRIILQEPCAKAGKQAPTISVHVQHPLILRLSHTLI